MDDQRRSKSEGIVCNKLNMETKIYEIVVEMSTDFLTNKTSAKALKLILHTCSYMGKPTCSTCWPHLTYRCRVSNQGCKVRNK